MCDYSFISAVDLFPPGWILNIQNVQFIANEQSRFDPDPADWIHHIERFVHTKTMEPIILVCSLLLTLSLLKKVLL